jgi:hypothetical protein
MAGIDTYDQGVIVRLHAVFDVPATGVLYDPAVIKARVKIPAGTYTEYTYGTDAALIRDGVGQYHLDQSTDTSGRWAYRFFSTGAGQAAHDRVFIVKRADT